MKDNSRDFDAAAALEETLAALEGRQLPDTGGVTAWKAQETDVADEPDTEEWTIDDDAEDAEDADIPDGPGSPEAWDEPDDAEPFDEDDEEGRKVFAGFGRKDDEEEMSLPSDEDETPEEEEADGEELLPAAFTVTSGEGFRVDEPTDELVEEATEDNYNSPSDDNWNAAETDIPAEEVPEEPMPSYGAALPAAAPVSGGYTDKEAMSLAMILVASIIAVVALLFSAVFYKAPVQTVPPGGGEDLSFVSDSDTVDVDDLTDNVIGVGVLYGSAKVYDAADGNVLGELPADTTLMIYASDHGYYRVTDIDNTLTGYIRKDEVNTGGVDVGNPDAPEQFVDDTGEPTEPTDSTEPTEPTEATEPSDPTEPSGTTAGGTTVTTTASGTAVTSKTASTAKKTTSTQKTTAASKTAAKTTTTTKKTTTTTKKTTTTTKSSDAVKPENFPVNASPYFIYVEKGSHTITVYAKDSHGKYTTPVRTYLTATGRTASLTPVGLFSVGGKEKWHSWGGKSYSPYATRYYSGLFFHGPLYSQKNFGTLIESSVSAIGTNASSGCMRTGAQAAYFIYAFCPSGTYVKIVNGSPLGRGAGRPSVKSQYVDPATNKVPVAGVTLKPDAKTVKAGDTFTVKAAIAPDNATEKACYWVSSNPKAASVKGSGTSCTVTAKAAGKAVITVTTVDGSYKATITVTVTEATKSTTASSTTKATETTKSTTKATETTKSTTKATETTKSTTKATETTKSTTKATETTKSTTKATETTKSTTKATESTKSTTKATETAKSTTKATETTKSTTKATETAKSTTKATESTKSTTKATETAKSTTKATETAKSTAKATESTKSTTKSTTKATESHASEEP